MGDNLMEQSISLLHVKDPLLKRIGASRFARFAIYDDRRMKIVKMGGGQELLKMLESAKDDRTRNEALKALAALSTSDEAVGVVHSAGLASVMKFIPDSSLEVDIQVWHTRKVWGCKIRYDLMSDFFSSILNATLQLLGQNEWLL